MPNAVIVSACRTPIGRYGKSLLSFSAMQLGAIAIKEAVVRARIKPGDVEEVIMGNVISAGLGQAPARQAAIYAGIPDSVPAFTVNKVCASGLKAIALAADSIRLGNQEILVAGGMESMSNAPYVNREARWGARLNDVKLVDAMVYDGLWDVYNNFHMGVTGEIVAQRYKITREDMDRLSYESHVNAQRATQEGRFKSEIVPVQLPGPDKKMFERDEGIRADTTIEKLAKLPAAFKEGGAVTAGNASQLSDGGAACVVMSEDVANKRNLNPLARIVDYASVGVKPEWVMEAPIPAVRKLLKKVGLEVKDIDLWEHNEAFASASCAVMKELGIPREKFNVNGGAVALGHPIGCSGARIMTTLTHAMRDRNARRGIETICLGGGNAMAMLVERT